MPHSSHHRRTIVIAIWVWSLALVSLVVLNLSVPSAHAQPITLTSVERPHQSNATWTLEDAVFESRYPDGFTFRIKSRSSGGEIVRARLVWYRPVLRPSNILTVYTAEVTFDAATGVYSATWQPDRTQMLPPWSQIKYHWEFRDAAGNEFQTEPALVEYADHTRPWVRRESDDVIVFTSDLEGDIEDLVLSAMAEQHDTYVAVWGQPLPYKPRIVLFGDYEAWLEWRTADTNTSDTSVVVGQTFDEWGVIVQVLTTWGGSDPYRELAYGTVLHEVEHLYQAEFLAARDLFDVPGWFFEGDATFFERYQSYDYEGKVRDLARADQLPPLLDGLGPNTGGQNPRLGYDIGYSFFVWLEDMSGGLEVHRTIMTLLAEDTPFIEALESAAGMSKAEMERAWRVWLGATPDAPTLIPTWTPPPLPVIATPLPPTSK